MPDRNFEEHLSVLSGLITRQLATMLELDRRATEIGITLDGLRATYIQACKEGNEDIKDLDILDTLHNKQCHLLREKVLLGKQCVSLIENARSPSPLERHPASSEAGSAPRTSPRVAALVANNQFINVDTDILGTTAPSSSLTSRNRKKRPKFDAE